MAQDRGHVLELLNLLLPLRLLDHLLHQTFEGESGEPESDLILDPNPDPATLQARVWDVGPDGTALLVTRGTYRIDAPALVERYPNVVVLRTFSKAYGLAGLRIGYGFCAPSLARRLWTMQPPFGIGITSLVAVAASYDAENQLRQRIRMIASERRYLRMRLRSMGS